jgi:Xaa-Pro aminopeptidase
LQDGIETGNKQVTDMLTTRRNHAAAIARKAGLGALAFVPGANFTYLTGLQFHLMERPTLLFVTDEAEVVAIMPELERQKWSQTFPAARTFYWQDADGYAGAFQEVGAALQGKMIGVEGIRIRVFEGDALRRSFAQGAVIDADIALIDLRLEKSPDEIAALQQAIDISEIALSEVLDMIRSGMTERFIAAQLKLRMLSNGAEGFSFDPIVLVAGNAANPHGVPGDRPLMAGDALLIDYGASFGGSHADITRTFFCGHVSDDHAAIYATVLAANAKGRDVAGPQVTAHELDQAVTGVLAASAYGDLIVHKTGHGLGMDIHEAPQIMHGNHRLLVPGTVFTIEPGLYRPSEIGVRIEDDVVIETCGARSLTRFARDLTVIGV